jgi:S-adenosylmethionine hydrolase
MIVLFTDYGVSGPYVGQLKRVLVEQARDVPIIELFADAPRFLPRPSAYLLAAYVEEFPAGSVFVAVVDPGVGTDRAGAAVHADGRWFVGPENGLFEIVVRRARTRARWWRLTYEPARLSATFHGRDIFAPVAAQLARGAPPPGEERPIAELRRPDWPDELAEVIYIDGFGNAMTGLSAPTKPELWRAVIGERSLPYAPLFAAVPEGEAFWYVNANALVEVAANRASAAATLGLRVGSPVLLASVGS